MSVSFPLCWSKVHSVKNPDHFAEEEGTAGVLIHVCYNSNTILYKDSVFKKTSCI